MSFKVYPDGAVECSTIDEVLELRARVMQTTAPAQNKNVPRKRRLTVTTNVRNVLIALLNNPNGLNTIELIKSVGLEKKRSLPPIIRIIQNLADTPLLRSSTVSLNERPIGYYQLEPDQIAFVKALLDIKEERQEGCGR